MSKLVENLQKRLDENDVLGFKKSVRQAMNRLLVEALLVPYPSDPPTNPGSPTHPFPVGNADALGEPTPEKKAVQEITAAAIDCGADTEFQYNDGIFVTTLRKKQGVTDFTVRLDKMVEVLGYNVAIFHQSSVEAYKSAGAFTLSQIQDDQGFSFVVTVAVRPGIVTSAPIGLAEQWDDDAGPEQIVLEHGEIVFEAAKKWMGKLPGKAAPKAQCKPGYKFDKKAKKCVCVDDDQVTEQMIVRMLEISNTDGCAGWVIAEGEDESKNSFKLFEAHASSFWQYGAARSTADALQKSTGDNRWGTAEKGRRHFVVHPEKSLAEVQKAIGTHPHAIIETYSTHRKGETPKHVAKLRNGEKHHLNPVATNHRQPDLGEILHTEYHHGKLNEQEAVIEESSLPPVKTGLTQAEIDAKTSNAEPGPKPTKDKVVQPAKGPGSQAADAHNDPVKPTTAHTKQQPKDKAHADPHTVTDDAPQGTKPASHKQKKPEAAKPNEHALPKDTPPAVKTSKQEQMTAKAVASVVAKIQAKN